MIATIYGWIGFERTFAEPKEPAGESIVSVFPLPEELNTTFIVVHAVGKETEVAEALRQCRQKRMDAVYAFLPLASPACPQLCEQCEAMGFSFAGIMPHIHDGGDRLLMQYVDIPLNEDAIRMYGDVSRELFSYILKEKSRVENRT